jgi:hypothetical protein
MAIGIEWLMACCYHRPSSAPCRRKTDTNNPVVIKGLGRHLELKRMSIKKKEDMEAREKEVFGVKNIHKYKRPEDGSTIIKVTQTSDESLSVRHSERS